MDWLVVRVKWWGPYSRSPRNLLFGRMHPIVSVKSEQNRYKYSTFFWQSFQNLHGTYETMYTNLKSHELRFWKHPSMVEKKIEICKQEVQAAQILSKNSKDGGMWTGPTHPVCVHTNVQYDVYPKSPAYRLPYSRGYTCLFLDLKLLPPPT
jgi:hypothetical protein